MSLAPGSWCAPDPAVLARDASREIAGSDRDIPGIWHSQIGQDKMVYALLQHKRGGFFVDLAANEAILISNTRTFERDHGWNGVCIEANPTYHHALMRKRKCRLVACAIADSERVMQFNFNNGGTGGLVGSKLDNTHAGDNATEVNTVPRRFDYLSLDVEGAESMVMQSFPWSRFGFNVLTVERPKVTTVNLSVAENANRSRVCEELFAPD